MSQHCTKCQKYEGTDAVYLCSFHAAAPELLRALQRMLQHHQGHACQPLEGDCAHEVARATIRTATER